MFCPSCGGQIEADRRFAKLVVCQYCESAVLLDEKAARVAGKMAVLAQTPSDLFVGGTGKLLDRNFRILGRVRYGYERGYWDEWYLAFDDGSTTWISEDENNFSLETHEEGDIPVEYAEAYPGQNLTLGETIFHIDEKGVANCEGGEGQLPFPIISGEKVPFLDLSMGDKFATVEYDLEDQTVRIFRGRRLNITDVQMDMTAEEAGVYASGGLKAERGADGERRERIVVTGERSRSVNCVCCGAPMTIPDRAGDTIACEYCGTETDLRSRRVDCPSCDASVAVHSREAMSVVCPQCHKTLNVSRTEATVLDLAAQVDRPPVPFRMGQKGSLRGVDYTIVGHVRYVERDEGVYRSDEFLMFSEAVGYQWLIFENNHFSFCRELDERPTGFEPRIAQAKQSFKFLEKKWRVFEHGYSEVEWVEGELPWVAQIGDQNYYMDAVCPPYLLTAEWTETEMEWYEAEYLPRQEVCDGFGVDPESIYKPIGVAPHQVFERSPFRKQARWIMWASVLVFGFFMFKAIGTSGRSAGSTVVTPEQYADEFLTESFQILDKDSLCEAEFSSPVDNSWEYFDVAVVNSKDEAVLDFSVNISYYHGYDGGSWSEGSRTEKVPFKLAEPGDYRFLLKGQAGRANTPQAGAGYPVTIKVQEGIQLARYYLAFAIFAFAWICIEWFRKASFEAKRWSESDAAGDDD